MIIKGRSRGRSAELAAHLLNAEQNERIQLYDCRGTVATNVAGALAEIEVLGAATRCRKPLYHASISPASGTPLTAAQLAVAVDALEAKLGFHGQPRVVVLHTKHGREHAHIVWSRIDLARARAISDSWNYARHEEVARELETRFDHSRVEGAFSRRHGIRRPRRTPRVYEFQQEQRSGIKRSAITDELTALWNASNSGTEFQAQITRAGYVLARGDRRDFVVLDKTGQVHSLARRIAGARSKDIKTKLVGIEPHALPTVKSARARIKDSLRTADSSANALSDRPLAPPTIGISPVRRTRATDVRARISLEMLAALSRAMQYAIGWKLNAPQDHRALRAAHQTERAAILSLYAEKIAAVWHISPPHEVDARIRALNAEQRAHLEALRERTIAEHAAIKARSQARKADGKNERMKAKRPFQRSRLSRFRHLP